MLDGKTRATLWLLTDLSKGGVLKLNDVILSNTSDSTSVYDSQERKQPPRHPAQHDIILQADSTSPVIHPVVFDSIDATMIRTAAALRTDGAAGPSGIDARGWRRLCTSFQTASNDLCHSLALLAKRLCTAFVDPQGLAPLLACRLIALDKNPGVRPIGICETARRIISKAVLSVIRDDIQQAAESIQLCAGQIAGTEAAVHAMNIAFSAEDSEAVLLVDASNAFNSLNRQAALLNIRSLCPPLATILINTYRHAIELFVDGTTLYSQEGTTQGDPLAMPMYAIAILPLIHRVNVEVKQVWYADDATATGCVAALREWWDRLVSFGPAYGYHVNASKTWLITKEPHRSAAMSAFQGTEVNIMHEGKPHLGVALGTEAYTEHYVHEL